jgi:hypothetical protein
MHARISLGRTSDRGKKNEVQTQDFQFFYCFEVSDNIIGVERQTIWLTRG